MAIPLNHYTRSVHARSAELHNAHVTNTMACVSAESLYQYTYVTYIGTGSCFLTSFFISIICSDVDMERHLVCEPCGGNVLGGYDPKKKQVSCMHICTYMVSTLCAPLLLLASSALQ